MNHCVVSIALIVAVSRLATCQQCSARGEVQLGGDFCKPDLKAWVTNEDGSEDWVEAFKINSTNSDASLCENSSSCFSWVSIGVPRLIPTVVHTSYDPKLPLSITTFLFSRTDFSFAVQLLSASQQLALASAASKTYGESVLTSRIAEFPVSQLSCNLRLVDEHGNSHVLYGQVLTFTKRPLTVHFQALVGSKERQLAEQSLQGWNTPQLIEQSAQNVAEEVACQAVYGAQTEKVKYLTVSGQAYETLVSQLLDSQSTQEDTEVMLTWTQFRQFASRVHELFSVGEQFRLSPNEFAHAFFDDLMQASVVSALDFFNASDALSKLSTFGITDCLADQNESDTAEVGKLGCSATEMLADLNSMFKSHLRNQTAKVNQEHVEELRDFGRLVNTKYLNLIELGSQFHKADETRKSLADMLRSLNAQKDAEVSWQLTRNRNIVVKSVKVTKLNKTLLNKNFTIKSVRKTDFITLFSRNFKLSFTKDGIVQQALGEAGYLNNLYATRYNQAVQLLAENLTRTANMIDSRYAAMNGVYDRRILKSLAVLESESVSLELATVKRCVIGSDLDKFENLSLIECREKFKEYSGAVGFNYYASNTTGASLCELKKPISGHTYLAKSVVMENCTFYYQRCKASGAKIYENKTYYTIYETPETLTNAQSRCSRLRQHVLELRSSAEVTAFANVGQASTSYFLNAFVNANDGYKWLSDQASINFLTLFGTDVPTDNYCVYASIQTSVHHDYRITTYTNRCVVRGSACYEALQTICQCNDYAAW